MKFTEFLKKLDEVDAHKGDDNEDVILKTIPLRDLSKMLHNVEITLRPPHGAEEVHWERVSTDDVISWFDWDQYIKVDFIATTKEHAVAAAKEAAELLKKQGAILMHAKYKIRDLAYERSLGSMHHNMRAAGPTWKDIHL